MMKFSRQRYLWTGAMIGLYFGYFFRPVREPSWLMVVGLSFLAALLTAVLAHRRGTNTRPFGQALLLSWAQFGVILAVFEGRHVAHDIAGRWGTIAFTTAMGALLGLWYWFTAVGVPD